MKLSILFLSFFIAVASAFAQQQQNQPAVKRVIVGCSVTRTYTWNQSQAYNDFAWGDRDAYREGRHFIGNFDLPCPYEQSYEYEVQPIYSDVVQMNRDEVYNY